MWASPPEIVSTRRKAAVLIATIIVALTRLVALSRAPWEWDEVLFASAVRDYDVVFHHPHPPGFPLFVGAAKVIALAGVPDFRALQAIVVAGAMLLFPLTFALGRELRLGFPTSFGGALIVAFAPNVWYYGGTAFSDVPGLAIVLGSAVLLLRGVRCPRSYVAGCLLLGIAAGFRPQLVVVPAVPFLIATWEILGPKGAGEDTRAPKFRYVVGGVVLAAAIVVGSYWGAAVASSSFGEYVDVVREQQEYIGRVDSFRSPTRPPLLSLMRTFFKPTRGAGGVDKVIPLLAAVGVAASLVRRRAGLWVVMAMFGPLALFSWLMLDLNAASRYVIGYLPMFAFLAAFGVESLATPLGPRFREALTIALCVACAGWFTAAAWETLRRVGREDPPLLEAMQHLETSADGHATIYSTEGVFPFADYYLPQFEVVDLTERPVGEEGFVVLDALSSAPCARNFIRRRGNLADIARARYFEASVVPAGGCQ